MTAAPLAVAASRAVGAVVEEEEILSRLRERLSAYKLPRRVLFPNPGDVDYTANQKLQIDSLRQWVEAQLSEEHVEIAGFVYG